MGAKIKASLTEVERRRNLKEKLRKRKLRTLNMEYGVRRKGQILSVVFITLFWILFIFLPIEWLSIAFFILGIWFFQMAYLVSNNQEYFCKLRILMPRELRNTITPLYYIIGGIFTFAIGIIVPLMDFYFPQIMDDNFFPILNYIHFYGVITLIFFISTVKYIHIKYQTHTDLNTIEALNSQLKQKSTNCPKCGQLSEQGYLRGIHICWHEPGMKKFVKPLLSRSQHAVPSNICRKCNLLFGQYTFPSKTVDFAQLNASQASDSNNCPHCKFPLKTGSIISNWAFIWSENPSKPLLFDRKKHFVSTAFPIRSPHLPTKKCKNCGLFFSIYYPENFRRSNFIGLSVYVITFIFAIYVLYRIIALMF